MAKKPPKIKTPKLYGFNESAYRSGKTFGPNLPLNRGYGVKAFNKNKQARNQQNGRLINVKGEYIDFYIEEIEANFQMGGSTAQSQKKRQFFARNFMMPSVTIRGRAPNSFQYNRLASFVRVGHIAALSTKKLKKQGIPLRTITDSKTGEQEVLPTLRLIVRDGARTGKQKNKYPYTGRTVKGRHQAWKLEGYVKMMPAGARRHDPAPAFEFEFMVAESQRTQDAPNVGIWRDHAVAGNAILPWIDIFSKAGEKGFVRRGSQVSPGLKGEDGISQSAEAIGDGIDAAGDILEDL